MKTAAHPEVGHADTLAVPASDGPGTVLVNAARIAFGVFFLGSSVLKIFAADYELDMMRSVGFADPFPLYAVAALSQALGGAALIANRLVRPAAIGLIVYVAIVNYAMHAFWMLEGEAWSIQFQLFTKNLGIMAGLAAVAGNAGTRSATR